MARLTYLTNVQEPKNIVGVDAYIDPKAGKNLAFSSYIHKTHHDYLARLTYLTNVQEPKNIVGVDAYIDAKAGKNLALSSYIHKTHRGYLARLTYLTNVHEPKNIVGVDAYIDPKAGKNLAPRASVGISPYFVVNYFPSAPKHSLNVSFSASKRNKQPLLWGCLARFYGIIL